jgi:hypothetical protein
MNDKIKKLCLAVLRDEVEKYQVAFKLFDKEEIAERIVEGWIADAEAKQAILAAQIRGYKELLKDIKEDGIPA